MVNNDGFDAHCRQFRGEKNSLHRAAVNDNGDLEGGRRFSETLFAIGVSFQP